MLLMILLQQYIEVFQVFQVVHHCYQLLVSYWQANIKYDVVLQCCLCLQLRARWVRTHCACFSDRQVRLIVISVRITKMLMGGAGVRERSERKKIFFRPLLGGPEKVKSWLFGCDEQYELFHAVYCQMRQNHQCSVIPIPDTSCLHYLLPGKRDTHSKQTATPRNVPTSDSYEWTI